MKPYDNLRFDASDAWLMFSIWLSVNGHHFAGGFAMLMLFALLWMDSRAEKESVSSLPPMSGLSGEGEET